MYYTHTRRPLTRQQGPGAHVIYGARRTVLPDLLPLGGAGGPVVCRTPTLLPTTLWPWAVEQRSLERPEFESPLRCWLAVWPWASGFTSLSLSVSVWIEETADL